MNSSECKPALTVGFLNVLMISADSTLAMDKDKVIGDSQDRHILYGRYLSKLFIVVRSRKDQNRKMRKLSDNVVVYPTGSRKTLSFIWDAHRISKRICRGNKIDVITTQDPLFTGLVGYMLSRKFKIPLNVQLHGNYLNNEFWLKESKLNFLFNILGNYIAKRADSIRVVADRIGNGLASRLNIPPEKFTTLPVFTDIDKFVNSQKVNLREKYLEFENFILFVGRLTPTKNIEVLLIAARKVLDKCPKTLFLIAGNGKMREEWERFACQLEIEQNVSFEGTVSHENIPSYYQSCDLLVLPSKHEGWPRVVTEALACRKPVIVSDACAISEFVINGECGFTFQSHNPQILAEQIIYLLQNPQVRNEMGKKGRECVKETMDINKNAYKNAELYRKTIELARIDKCQSG